MPQLRFVIQLSGLERSVQPTISLLIIISNLMV